MAAYREVIDKSALDTDKKHIKLEHDSR